MRTASLGPVDDTTPLVGRRGRWLSEHRPFLVALVLAAVLRVVVSVALTPALVFSDGPTYLSFLDTFEPHPDRPVGYGLLLLYPVSLVTDTVLAVAAVQHLVGLATASLLYVLLRRWGVGRWPATLATLPVLFDTLQLALEHSVLSDTLFQGLLVLAFVVLGWRRRPTPAVALSAGLILGVAVTVRQVGEPLAVMGAAFCLLAGTGWRGRLVAATALVVGFAVPVTAYATWFHHERGTYALSEYVGKSLYMRTTTFVDCPGLSVPDYQRVLCPPEPRGQRLDPTYYGWHDERTIPALEPPPGTTRDQALRAFAFRAIREQPVDYTLVVLRDFALNFDVSRGDRFEYATADKWLFSSYLNPEPTDWTGPAYEEHGGDQLAANQPWADGLASYERAGYLPGPLLFGCLILGLVGGLGVGPARRSGKQAMCLLLTVSGTCLLLVPDLAAEFVWRYQLPALAFLPAGAAVAYSALRGGRVDEATVATARTD